MRTEEEPQLLIPVDSSTIAALELAPVEDDVWRAETYLLVPICVMLVGLYTLIPMVLTLLRAEDGPALVSPLVLLTALLFIAGLACSFLWPPLSRAGQRGLGYSVGVALGTLLVPLTLSSDGERIWGLLCLVPLTWIGVTIVLTMYYEELRVIGAGWRSLLWCVWLGLAHGVVGGFLMIPLLFSVA